jgi:rubrerythrin
LQIQNNSKNARNFPCIEIIVYFYSLVFKRFMMDDLGKTITAQQVMRAFAIETQAIQKYLWFAKVATKEGYQQIAAIFTETAEQKKSHTKTLFRFLEGVELEVTTTFKAESIGTTLENLKVAFVAESQQHDVYFAEFEQDAWNEGFKQIATKFKLFRQIKKFYADRFEKLAANIENGMVFIKDEKVKWICRKCGFIIESDRALKNCPGCEHPQAYFEILAENY